MKKKRINSVVVAILFVGILGIALFNVPAPINNSSYIGENENTIESITGQWIEEDGKKYYLDERGKKVTGEQLIDNQVYYFNSDGAWDEADPIPAGIVSVQSSGETTTHLSVTGGATWTGGEVPEYYMVPNAYVFPYDVNEIAVTIRNNSITELTTGVGFRLLVWDGTDWIPSAADGLHHTDEGYYVFPGKTLEMVCGFRDIPLEAGRYKLIKEAQLSDSKASKIVFSVEFELKQ